MKQLIPVLIALFVSCANLLSGQETDFIKERSKVEFKIKNGGFWVKGSFSEFNIAGTFISAQLEKSQLKGTLSVQSIDTGIKKRDAHLLEEKYFDAGKFPKIKIDSKNIKATAEGYVLEGDLRIKETTKAISIPFTVEENENYLLLKGQLTLDRLDYGVGGKSWLMNRNVIIDIECALKAS